MKKSENQVNIESNHSIQLRKFAFKPKNKRKGKRNNDKITLDNLSCM